MRHFLCLLFITTFTYLSYAIKPERGYRFKPEDLGLTYTEEKITTSDGYTLNAWVMESTHTIKKPLTIIIAGSDAGNMAYNLGRAKALIARGYRVVTFDYRGFGESDEFTHNPDMLYHSEYIVDCIATLTWVKSRYPQSQIGVHALSMGTMMSAVAHHSVTFDYYIAEGFIFSPDSILERLALTKDKHLTLPDNWQADTRVLQKLNIPCLIFSASKDETTTPSDCQAMKDLHKNVKIISFDDQHLMGIRALGVDSYFDEIENFLSKQ